MRCDHDLVADLHAVARADLAGVELDDEGHVLLFWGRTTSMSQACVRAAAAILTAVVLAPAARTGYLVYPVDLIVWATAFRWRDEHVVPGANPGGPPLAPVLGT